MTIEKTEDRLQEVQLVGVDLSDEFRADTGDTIYLLGRGQSRLWIDIETDNDGAFSDRKRRDLVSTNTQGESQIGLKPFDSEASSVEV